MFLDDLELIENFETLAADIVLAGTSEEQLTAALAALEEE